MCKACKMSKTSKTRQYFFIKSIKTFNIKQEQETTKALS
jgi:hypothetical protein